MHRCRKYGYKNLLTQALLALPLLGILGSCASDAPRVTLAPASNSTGSVPTPRDSIVAISAILHGAPDLAKEKNLSGARLASALEGASRTAGTGFAIAPGGYILTARHVVADASQIWLTTSHGDVRSARVVAVDDAADLALLRADGLRLAPLEIATSLPVPGDRVSTYGNPAGRGTSGQLVHSGGLVGELNCTLARLSRREHRDYSGLIQSYMPLSPGDSGGPLLDEAGRLIGINAAAVLPTPDTSARGYAFAATPAWLSRVQALLDSCR